MVIFFAVLGAVAFAELGDKTQFLAIALASKYRWQPLFLGISLSILLLMGLAVLAGGYLLTLLPTVVVKIVAGSIFLLFAILSWLDRGEKKKQAQGKELPAFWTAFLSFFLSEFGDKTQLLTMALAAEYRQPLLIWVASSCALIIVDGFALFLGNRLGKWLPRKALRYAASVLFFVFGVLTILSAFFQFLPF